jgi:hypothetical protein
MLNTKSIWTRFMDMHSGGGEKNGYAYILIEAPQAEAEVIFYNRFDSNPNRVTCTCCGEDYSIGDGTLQSVTGYDRNLRSVEQKRDPVTLRYEPLPEGIPNYLEPGQDVPEGFTARSNRYGSQTEQTLAEYEQRTDVLFITADDIKPEERNGEVPEQGYVWQD